MADEPVPALQVELVGLEVARSAHDGSGSPRPGESSARSAAAICKRHVGLDREDVGELAVVRLRPEVLVGFGVDELGHDPHPVAHAPHASLQEGRRRQQGADFPQALLALLEHHHRGARNDLERPDLRQLGDDVLGDPVREVLVLRLGAEVQERQHGDGPRRGARTARVGECGGEVGDRWRTGRREPWPAPSGSRAPTPSGTFSRTVRSRGTLSTPSAPGSPGPWLR